MEKKPEPLPPGKYPSKIISDPSEKFAYVEIIEGEHKGKRFNIGLREWYFPGEKEGKQK